MLYWNTVTAVLKEILIKLMKADQFNEFRLVGGTALSLHWGHRMSVDIDLFTDAPYGSINFEAIELFLKDNFNYADGNFGGNSGMGKSYLVGPNHESAIKLDLYYSMDPFFQPFDYADGIRMATVKEILAMKIDIVQRSARKKDFWDLHEGLDRFTIIEMINLHKQRFEWTHDEELIRKNFTDFSAADDDFDPICLKSKEWIFIKEDIQEAITKEMQ